MFRLIDLAIHNIFDMSATHFLAELSQAIEKNSKNDNRKYLLIAESDLNDNKVTRSRQRGGYQLDAQWNDDFHHSLHAMLTEEEMRTASSTLRDYPKNTRGEEKNTLIENRIFIECSSILSRARTPI